MMFDRIQTLQHHPVSKVVIKTLKLTSLSAQIVYTFCKQRSLPEKKSVAFITMLTCLCSCKSMTHFDSVERQVFNSNSHKTSSNTQKPKSKKASAPITTLALREQELADIMSSSQPRALREHKKLSSPSSKSQIQDRLLAQYSEWKGTPYRFGGNSKRGIDCSAFLQRTFKAHFGFNLPRSTKEQVKVGKRISKRNLKPGDLIFFKTGRSKRHVGVYIGDSKFMHASSSRGVTITSIHDKYWRSRYWKSKRVI